MVRFVRDRGQVLAISQEYGLSGRGTTEEKALKTLNLFLDEMKEDQQKEERQEGKREKWTRKDKKITQRRSAGASS